MKKMTSFYKDYIPFNKPYMTGKELYRIAEAHFAFKLSGDGDFTRKCNEWLEIKTGCKKAVLTHSCTAALEMCAILLDIKEGDEIIMPSYTFVSTANAFVLRGGIPVFIDIREDTLNVDEDLIENSITKKTKAIVVVHYAGVSCNMDRVLEVADKYNIPVIEDAAQGVMASYKGRPLGSMGALGAISFHETKNIICGEGGALLINDSRYITRAEIVREKGTNRKKFFRGEIDKYTWVDIGSSFLPGELIAAFLWAQMEEADEIQAQRLRLWNNYHNALADCEAKGLLRRPVVPEDCEHNAHMYYALLGTKYKREVVLNEMKKNNINAVFHYIPLHSSPAGIKYGRVASGMCNTDRLSESLIRLPLFNDMSIGMQEDVVHCLKKILLS